MSPACRYLSPSTLLLNVSGEIAAFWEIKKNSLVKTFCHRDGKILQFYRIGRRMNQLENSVLEISKEAQSSF
jgi:hypothetical protein